MLFKSGSQEKKASFVNALEKVAVSGANLDRAGLGLLAVAPAYHAYKAVKDKDKTQAAMGATELGGLGLLYKAVGKAHA